MPENRTPSGGRRSLDPAQRAYLRAWAAEVTAEIDDRRRRGQEGLDVKSLAKDLGIARSTLINWLAGEAPPDPWIVRRVAEELSLPLDHQLDLLGWRPRMAASDGAVGNRPHHCPAIRALHQHSHA
jgi:DNA-binding XRE family transcriptional regulator